MNALTDVILAQSTAIHRAYQAGHSAGYDQGFADAIAAARKLLEEAGAGKLENTSEARKMLKDALEGKLENTEVKS